MGHTQKQQFLRTATILVVLAVMASAIPAAPLVRAQDSDDTGSRALIARTLTALAETDTYRSYAAIVEGTWEQSWTGRLGNFSEGQHQTVSVAKQVTAATRPELTIQELITVSENLLYNDQPVMAYVMEGDLRVVADQTYANARYVESSAGELPRLPPDWIELVHASQFDLYPGLEIVIDREVYPANAATTPTLTRLLGINLVGTTVDMVKPLVSDIRSTTTTLDDGRPVEAVTAVLTPQAILALNLFGSQSDPIFELIVAAIDNDPLALTVYLDDDRVVGLDLDLKVSLTDLSLESLPDAPAGYVLSIEMLSTQSVRFTSINEPVAVIAAPEIPLPTGYARPAAPGGELRWWNDRVFYEVFVRSFYDSDGDGKGDLPGLIEQLDYLNDGDPTTTDDLGITGIWLMPVMQSPSYHGYDVVDYWTIEDDYGTNADFKAFIEAAHERGIAVIIDLVLNHTSNEHPWFIAAEQGDPFYEDFYIWADEPGNFLSPWGSPVWHASGDRYYYGLFWSGMPDLNYYNPAVTVEMYDITWHWLEDMGADGFRLDAIRHLFEDGAVLENVPETLTWLEGFDTFVHSVKPDTLTVGEIWDTSAEVAPYVPDKVDVAFEFDLAQAILTAAQTGVNLPLIYTISAVRDLYPTGQYATFLTNHDQNRVLSQLENDESAAKVAASILLTGPGVPFVYYGEEIGMVGEKPDERIRTPMQWDSSTGTAGFSTVLPWQRVAENYRKNNVAAMTDDPGSLLNHYRALIQLRARHPALQTGTVQLVETGTPEVYSLLRYGEGETVLVLINLSDTSITDYALTVREGLLEAPVTVELLLAPDDAEIEAPTITETGGFDGYQPLTELPPQSTTIIQLTGS